jgi:nucleotide-binding universal stress UspA family protein
MQQTKERTLAEVVVRPHTYSTILVHAEPGLGSSRRVEAATRLARELNARLIGLGAETFDPALFSGPFTGFAAGEWVTLVQDEIAKNLSAAEEAFRRDAAGADIDWRTFQDYPHKALVQSAHAVDLIVVSPQGKRSSLTSANPGDVVMSAGRPVLVVPETGKHLSGMSVVVAWKDTRECRRALSDAMPFLQRADEVTVLAAVRPDETDIAVFETDDVVANLKRHGVDARALVSGIGPEAVEDEIERVAELTGADLVVAGAYGHSRLREWAFGGVTDTLLHQPSRYVLLSH